VASGMSARSASFDADGFSARNVTCLIASSPARPENGLSRTTASSWAADLINTVTAMPRSVAIFSSIALRMRVASDLFVLKTTLPLWTYVSTSRIPSDSKTPRRSCIETLPLPPTLTPFKRDA
jgi:hypothetical protein